MGRRSNEHLRDLQQPACAACRCAAVAGTYCRADPGWPAGLGADAAWHGCFSDCRDPAVQCDRQRHPHHLFSGQLAASLGHRICRRQRNQPDGDGDDNARLSGDGVCRQGACRRDCGKGCRQGLCGVAAGLRGALRAGDDGGCVQSFCLSGNLGAGVGDPDRAWSGTGQAGADCRL